MRRFAKPLSGVTCSEGSNPSLSASAPVAQWIERQVADLKVVGSSPAGRATHSSPYWAARPMYPNVLYCGDSLDTVRGLDPYATESHGALADLT